MAYDNTNKGAIWTKTAKSGLVYKSGILNVEGKDYNISMFDNDKAGNPNRPDFNVIIEAVEKPDTNKETNNSNSNNNNGGNDDGSNGYEGEISVEDIPF